MHYSTNIIVLLLTSSLINVSKPCNGESVAFFIFGDSTVDSGNNNYINTTPENRADYKPYGQNGLSDEPTGRFTNGRIFVDFIAENAKLPLIPPFMDPSAEYTNGVNFASGGAGVLPETSQGKVIDLPTQLKNFEVVRKTLAEKYGDVKAKNIISDAVYFISVGSNDYLRGYLASPALRAANPEPNPNGACFQQANMLARAHNHGLSVILQNLQAVLEGFKYSNTEFYDWFQDRLENPSKYGFKDGVNACCGTGLYGGTDTCGGIKAVKHYDLCERPEDYVWWDYVHATEKIHEQVAKDLWDGPASFVSPYNLKNLFVNKELTMTIADIVDIDDANSFEFDSLSSVNYSYL